MLSTQCSFQPTLEFNPQLLSVCYCFQPTIAFHFCFQSAIVFNQLFNSTHYCSLPTIAFSHYCFQQLLSFQIHCHFTFQPTAPFNNKLWLSTHSNFQKATAFHNTDAFNRLLLSIHGCFQHSFACRPLLLAAHWCFQPAIAFNPIFLSTCYCFQHTTGFKFNPLLLSTFCFQPMTAIAINTGKQLLQPTLAFNSWVSYCFWPIWTTVFNQVASCCSQPTIAFITH